MQRLIFTVTLIFLLSSCTKEVPENDKKPVKSVDEKNIQETIDNYYLALNSGDIEKASSLVDNNFRGVMQDMSEVIGLNSFKDNLRLTLNKYQSCKWKVKITEINILGDYAYSFTTSSLLVNNKAKDKMNDTFTEKALRVLKRQKNDGWKIYRFIALQNTAG